MDSLTVFYQTYLAEYEKLDEKIYRDEQGFTAKELGSKFGKEQFKTMFKLTVEEQLAQGEKPTPRQVARLMARRQLEYIPPTKQERFLEIFEKPEAVELMREKGYTDLLEKPITKDDLQRGTPLAQRLSDFLDKKYKDYKDEGLTVEQAKSKISQIFFGS